MPMPIAGLMSDRSGEWVDHKLTDIHEKAYTELGISGVEPVMTLCFMSLAVIPETDGHGPVRRNHIFLYSHGSIILSVFFSSARIYIKNRQSIFFSEYPVGFFLSFCYSVLSSSRVPLTIIS